MTPAASPWWPLRAAWSAPIWRRVQWLEDQRVSRAVGGPCVERPGGRCSRETCADPVRRITGQQGRAHGAVSSGHMGSGRKHEDDDVGHWQTGAVEFTLAFSVSGVALE
ncbi:hypothetical protein NDU88_006705 [Pleurodeles waltl]|uniref:Uncharacterized protein n=1 Tax=Pleurodeles waltl TaxID=8319 RepID=A0AAV7RQW3_PLEWA|nr:hypothetical protein NDU88_006705 [Pleurodeles waltl]